MPSDLAHPIWIEDDDIDLDYHVRHAVLPKPGTTAQLDALAARLHSTTLDRNRPPWEFHVIEGLQSVDGADLTLQQLKLPLAPAPAAPIAGAADVVPAAATIPGAKITVAETTPQKSPAMSTPKSPAKPIATKKRARQAHARKVGQSALKTVAAPRRAAA